MDSLREVAVKVNNGSGVLVKLDNKSYVITAIHCINETGDNTILSADESIKYKVEKKFFHPKREEDKEKNNEGDIVILKVEGMGAYPSFEMTNNVNSHDKVEAYGFPTKQRRGEPLSGSISQWNSDITTIKTELTYIGSNNDDEEARNNIEGWSGSGVFKKIDGKNHLIGILKKLTDNEHTYQTINCISSNIIDEVIKHNHLAPIKKKNQELTSLPPINPNFIGREADLKTIKENLNSDNVVCVVNGIGGVGKSELSYKYLHEHKNEYNKIAFIEMTQESASLEDVFRFKFQDALHIQAEDSFDTIIKRLQALPKKNLLLLDNLLSNDDFKKIKPLNINFDILVTTRAKLDSKNILNLETLSNEDAKELFLSIYDTSENIEDVLKYLDNHPLFINLTAYSLKEEYIELEELKENIKSGRVTDIDSKDEKTFEEHLQDTFNKQFQDEENEDFKTLLQVLALFPATEISFEMLSKMLDEKKLKFKLLKLVSRGWLSKKENSYKLHQIIKTFILEEYFIEYENATYILKNIGIFINPDDTTLIANKLSNYIPIIDSLLALYQDKKDDYIASILDSNTYLYYSLGEYSNSLKMQGKSLEIREKLYGKDSEKTAKSYDLLGIIYDEKGEY